MLVDRIHELQMTLQNIFDFLLEIILNPSKIKTQGYIDKLLTTQTGADKYLIPSIISLTEKQCTTITQEFLCLFEYLIHPSIRGI